MKTTCKDFIIYITNSIFYRIVYDNDDYELPPDNGYNRNNSNDDFAEDEDEDNTLKRNRATPLIVEDNGESKEELSSTKNN